MTIKERALEFEMNWVDDIPPTRRECYMAGANDESVQALVEALTDIKYKLINRPEIAPLVAPIAVKAIEVWNRAKK